MLRLPTNDPLGSISKLKHIEGDTFRRVRDDDELGEKIRFETDKKGRVINMWHHHNFAPRIR